MVSGWRGLDEHLEPTYERDADWHDVDPMGNLGCRHCDWRGARDQLQPLGIDDQPLPVIHPAQLTIESAAA
jgi:hypothetical protein